MAEIYANEQEVKPKKKQDINLWHERVGIAKKSLEDWAETSGAKRFIKEYKGDYGIVFNTRNKRVPVPPINEVFAYVQSDIATTYNRDPYITVIAEAGSTKGAALWEVILNYYWRILKTKEELEFEIIDKDLVGYSWHKVGTTVNSVGTDDTPDVEEYLYSNYLSWKDVVWNISSKRVPNECQWMAQRIVKPISEIKKKYKAAKGLEGVPNPEVDDDSYKKSAYKDDIKVGILWEIWDKQNKQVLLIAEGLKDRYLEPPKPWPDYLSEFPFIMYWDFAVPGGDRPMSAIAPWEAQILEEMVIMGSAVNHTKRWNRQVFVRNGSIDDNALDKFERGDDGAIINVNAPMEDGSFKFADFGALPTDFYLLMDRLQAIKRNINGQPEFVRGGVTKTGTRTIGELQLIEQGSKGRQDRKIDRLETHCENIARHLLAHLKANFDVEQTLKITGDTPEEIIEALKENIDPETGQIIFTPEEIKGEYDVKVKSGSTLPLNKENRTQALEIVLQTVAQVVSQGSISPFMNVLIQEILRDYDIKSLEEAYQLEVEQARVAQERAAQEETVDKQKTRAEATKRLAQAREISVETEMKGQEAQLGPVGRAQVERFKKEPIGVNGNAK